jgi:hypothetical protein
MIAKKSTPKTRLNSSLSLSNSCETVNTKVWGRLFSFKQGVVYDLMEPVYTLGRSPNCDIQLSDAKLLVSSLHFVLEFHQNYCLLKDNSRNGTIVNGEKVDEIPLADKCEISVCFDYHFVFLYPNSKLPLILNKYYIFKSIELGRGSFAHVNLAYDTINLTQIACKTINLKGFTKKENFIKEINFLSSCNHPNIVKIHDFIINQNIQMFLDLIKGGELFDLILKTKLGENEIMFLFYQLVKAIKYLHDNGICHRDIKAENILLDSMNGFSRLVLCDFGLSCEFQSKMSTRCGTSTYCAPEVLDPNNKYTEKVDCWSMGVLLYTSKI